MHVSSIGKGGVGRERIRVGGLGGLSPQPALTPDTRVAPVQSTISLIPFLDPLQSRRPCMKSRTWSYFATAWTLGLFCGSEGLRTESGYIIVVHLLACRRELFIHRYSYGHSTWIFANKTRLVAPFCDGYIYPYGQSPSFEELKSEKRGDSAGADRTESE